MIPVIHYLLQFQCQILISATGGQKKLLEQEFPDVSYLTPPSYNIHYPGQDQNLILGLVRQLPRLTGVVRREKQWVKLMIQQHGIDLIISDNRYGFRNKEVNSVFICHQLAPITGLGPLLDHITNILHVALINRFTECWVPDIKGQGLAGKLSNPSFLPKSLKFLGPVSRFGTSRKKNEKKDLLLIILSGPEPRRSDFEKLLLTQLKPYKRNYMLIRGLPSETKNDIPNSYNHLASSELEGLIQEASMIVCRSGYTSIMDLVALGKTAVLVPTPGQTEQEYLARHLSEKHYFLSASEENFVLEDQLALLQHFTPQQTTLDFNAFKVVLDEVIAKLKQQA